MAESMKTYVPAVPPSQQANNDRRVPPPPEAAPPASVADATVQQPPITVIANVPARRDHEPTEYRHLEAGAQYLPAEKPRTFLEILPAQYETTRPPLIYRLSTVSEPSRPYGRIAQSRIYRAKAFSCLFFYKPISRCLVDWEDR
jgi:hypothetical protein